MNIKKLQSKYGDDDQILDVVKTQIQIEHDRAKVLPYVRKPLAYALHQVWEYWDTVEARVRCEQQDG